MFCDPSICAKNQYNTVFEKNLTLEFCAKLLFFHEKKCLKGRLLVRKLKFKTSKLRVFYGILNHCVCTSLCLKAKKNKKPCGSIIMIVHVLLTTLDSPNSNCAWLLRLRWDFFALIVQAVTMTSVWIAFKDYSWKTWSSEIWSIPFYIPIPPVHLPAQDVPDPP